MSKKMKIIFTLSVILNVLFIGLVAGKAVHKFRDHSPVEKIAKDMSPEGRHIVARTMQNAFREGRDKMKEMRKTKDEMKKIITADEFDPEAFEEQAEKMHSMFAEMGQKRIEVTKELAGQLSKEDRVKLAEGFAKGFHGRGKKDEGRTHEFLKELEKRKERFMERRNKVENKDEGPDMPEDMPPQP